MCTSLIASLICRKYYRFRRVGPRLTMALLCDYNIAEEAHHMMHVDDRHSIK